MPLRRNHWGWIFWAVAGLIALSGCLEEPGSEYYLHLSLNDSLSNYDSIEIVLVSSSDTSNVLATVHNGPLPNPRGIAPYRLPDGLTETQFEVRVRGYIYEGQLGLETRITKSGSNLSIVHTPIVEPAPYSVTLNYLALLNPNGLLIPKFDSGITDYEGLVALNIDSVEIYATALDFFGRAQIFIDSVPFAPAVKTPVSTTPRRVNIMVTNNGKQRVYQVNLKKDSRAGPHLRVFQTSTNTWSPNFNRDSLVYSMSVPNSDSVLRFDSLLIDSSSTLILNNRDTISADTLFAGFRPGPIPLLPGNNTVTMKLSLSGSLQNYTFNVFRDYAPELLKFETADDAFGGTCTFCGNFWSPAFQPSQLTYLQGYSLATLPRIYFDSLEAAPGYTAEISYNGSGFTVVPRGTLPSPITLSGLTDIIRIRITKTGLTNPPIYTFTLTP